MLINIKTSKTNFSIFIDNVDIILPIDKTLHEKQVINNYNFSNSMKGVEFYIVDLIKILNIYGIRKFDIVPEWAK